MLLAPIRVYAYHDEFCPPHETKVIIDNRITPESLQYDYSKSVHELTRMAGKVLPEGAKGGVFGLFSRKVGYRLHVSDPMEAADMRMLTYDGTCIKKIIVTITLINDDPTIYVGREFLEGTETYNYVQWHENEHARIVIENNKRYIPYLKHELERYIAGMQFRVPESINEFINTYSYINEKIRYVTGLNIDKLNNFIKYANADFDAKEKKHGLWLAKEYEKVKEQ